MARETTLYQNFEDIERGLGQIYLSLHDRFRTQPDLARFWRRAAMDEMYLASILRFCRESLIFSAERVDNAAVEEIQELLATVNAVVRSPDVSLKEIFYAALLIESSAVNEIYRQLTNGLAEKHGAMYRNIRARIRSHHERFAEATGSFLGETDFGDVFMTLSDAVESDSTAKPASSRVNTGK